MRGRVLTGTASLRKLSVVARAAALFCGEIESSRSRSSASAPLARPFSSFFGLSPGMKRKERMKPDLVCDARTEAMPLGTGRGQRRLLAGPVPAWLLFRHDKALMHLRQRSMLDPRERRL